MAGKFNPDDLRHPLYEHSQVITEYDLSVIWRGLAVHYQRSKWWEIRHRYNLLIAGQTVKELMLWLNDGKPTLRNQGEI